MMNNLKTFALLAALTAMVVGVGAWLGGRTGMVLALGLAVVMNVGSYWFSDKIALSMSHAQEVSPAEAPELHNLIASLASRAGLPKPRVYVTPDRAPNAFATGRDPEHSAIAVTHGLTELLSPDEIEGVLAHEMAHIKNRDVLISTIAATLAGALVQLANWFQWAAIFGGRDDERGGSLITDLLFIVLAPIAAALVQMAVSRSREFEADRTGSEICGRPLSLASALTKLDHYAHAIPLNVNPAVSSLYIVEPRTVQQRLANLFSTHPSTAERVERLQRLSMGG